MIESGPVLEKPELALAEQKPEIAVTEVASLASPSAVELTENETSPTPKSIPIPEESQGQAAIAPSQTTLAGLSPSSSAPSRYPYQPEDSCCCDLEDACSCCQLPLNYSKAAQLTCKPLEETCASWMSAICCLLASCESSQKRNQPVTRADLNRSQIAARHGQTLSEYESTQGADAGNCFGIYSVRSVARIIGCALGIVCMPVEKTIKYCTNDPKPAPLLFSFHSQSTLRSVSYCDDASLDSKYTPPRHRM